MFKKQFYLFFILILAIFMTGCSFPWQSQVEPEVEQVEAEEKEPEVQSLEEPELSSGDLKKFSNYQDLRDFLATNVNNIQANYSRELPSGVSDFAFSKEMNAIDSLESISGASTDDYSRTNVQVAGVDEADIIKTDGQYIYALVYKDLYIIKATPAEQARALTKLSFPSRPKEMYINKGLLVVIGADNQIMESKAYKNFRRHSPYTFVRIFDVSNPEEPKSARDLSFEGSYRDSRLIDGRLYLIINNYEDYIAGETVVPRLIDDGAVLSNNCENNNKCFAPDVYYFDIPYQDYNLTSINTLDLRTEAQPVMSQSYLLSGAQNIYVSASNIFITYTQYLNEIDVRATVLRDLLFDRLSSSEQDLLLQVENLDNLILSHAEKRQKIMQIFQRFLDSKTINERSTLDIEIETAMKKKYEEEANNWERTLIYKFGLNNGAPVYRAKGSVPGTVLNQFSLDEDSAGRLRIATTRSRNFHAFDENQESYSNLYVLSTDLKSVGSVEKLAPGERIFSVRFMGNRAYLVTFKQMDPLFVIDLSNPQAPRVLGELKIPGFSNYLHPYDENTLIGLGRDVQVDVYGNTKNGGIKLSLFDVSNPAMPRELDTYIAGEAGSNSLALDNHKAFLFSKDKNLLVIPASLTSLDSRYRPYFSGALVFSLDNKKFNLKGEIDHSDGGRYLRADNWCGSSCYDNSVQRALYIQNTLYTFSNKYLKLNSLSDLSGIRSIKLVEDTETDLKLEPITPNIPKPVLDPVIINPEIPIGPMAPSLPMEDPSVEDPFLEEEVPSVGEELPDEEDVIID